MSKLLATDFGIWPMAKNAHLPTENILKNKEYLIRLIDYLMLYDQIIIPTGDLQIVYVLRLLLGDDIFEKLIRNETIVLVRFDRWFLYGNDGTVINCQYEPPPKPGANLLINPHDPLEIGIEKILAIDFSKNNTKNQRKKFKNILMDKIQILPSFDLISRASKEAYKDFENSQLLKNCFNLTKNPINVSDMPSKESTSFAMMDPHNTLKKKHSPNINSRLTSTVLKVVFENFILCLRDHTDSNTLVGDNQSISILNAKGQRFGFVEEKKKAFTNIMKFEGLPNLSEEVALQKIAFNKFIDIRNLEEGIAFREWFSNGNPFEKNDDIIARYREASRKVHFIDKRPIKSIRFAIVSYLDMITNGVASITDHLVDNYFQKKWFKNKSPHLYLQEVKKFIQTSDK